MKLHISLRGCGEINYERQPMSTERFNTVLAVIGGGMGLWFIYALLTAAMH